MPRKREDKPSRTEVHLAWVLEINRTIRWLIVAAGIVGAIAVIANAVVKIATHENPPWLTIVLTIIGAIALGAAPTVRWIFKFRAYMKADHQRVVELELKRDPDRESTGLKENGTSPHDI